MSGLKAIYQVSVRQACDVISLNRSSYYYQPTRDDTELANRIREIAETHIRYGYKRIHVLLKREGWKVNHKRVYRIYSSEGMSLRRKRPRRRVAAAHREAMPSPGKINQCWSMDFVADSLFDGRQIRALTIVDNFSRQSLAIQVGHSIKGHQVVGVMESLRLFAGLKPQRIKVDNGSEFISKVMDKWAYENGVVLDFSRPGKPTDNAFIESFNGSFRDECLNTNWFLSLDEAKQKIEDWRERYNRNRPHSSLGYLTPDEFAEKHNQMPEVSNYKCPALG